MKVLNYTQYASLSDDESKSFVGVVISKSGSKHYYVNGKLHRTDGPAYDGWDGTQTWWFEGRLVNVHSQEEFESWLVVRAFE